MNSKTILWGLLASALMVLPACGDDDDNNGDGPNPSTSGQQLTSMTSMGMSVATFRYDNKGRITRIELTDEATFEFSYSPLKITYIDDEERDEWYDIKTNDAGYIISAKRTEYYDDGDTDQSTLRFEYDSQNRFVTAYLDGETDMTMQWDGGNAVSCSVPDNHYTETFTYTTTENKGNVSLMWGDFAMWWMSGLFGKVPAHLPSAMDTNYGDHVKFAYKLNSNGTIASEQVSYEGEGTFVISYNYTSSRAAVDEGVSADAFRVFGNKTGKNHRVFKKR